MVEKQGKSFPCPLVGLFFCFSLILLVVADVKHGVDGMTIVEVGGDLSLCHTGLFP
jgi:hypothetical protein